jgi:hypothetical protein
MRGRTSAIGHDAKRNRSARILAAGHAPVKNLRCGYYDIATHVPQVTGSAQPSTSSL